MKQIIALCLIVLLICCSISIEARRWRPRPAPRVRVVRVRSCSTQCTPTPRVCTAGGCAEWGTRASTSCVRHATQQVCSRWGTSSTRVCVSTNARCAQWNFVNQKVCKRYTTVRVPINQLVDGKCLEVGKRCALEKTIPKAVCARYGTKCVDAQPTTRKVCVRRAATKCIKTKVVTNNFCAQTERKCAQVKEIVPKCEEKSQACSKLVAEDFAKKCGDSKCLKKHKFCVRKQKYTYSTCSKYAKTNKCLKHAERSAVQCTKRKTVCTNFKTLKYKVCTSRRRACKRYVTQKLGTKCVQTKYRVNKTKKCVQWRRIGSGKGKCIPTKRARRVCIKRRNRKCIKFGFAAKTRRVCARYTTKVTRTAYCAKRAPIVKKVCAAYSRPCSRFTTRTKKVCTKRGVKCTCSKTIKKKYCSLYARKCVKKVRRTGIRCAKWAERCVKRSENKISQCATVTKLCSASGFLRTKTCARWENVCKKRITKKRTVCVQRKAVGKCLEYKTINGVQCNKTKRVCEQYKTVNETFCAKHGHYCKRPSKVWKTVAYKNVSKCADWGVVRKPVSCARYNRSCTRYVTKRTGLTCLAHTTRRTCVQQHTTWHRYCKRNVAPRCSPAGRSCVNRCEDRFVTVRGDVHLMVGGKFVDFNYAGVFDYFSVGPCAAQIRLDQLKAATVLTGLAVKCENDKFVASPEEVSVNGKALEGESTKVGDKGSVTKLGDNKYVYKTGFGFDITLEVEKNGVLGARFHETAEAAQHFKAAGLMKKGSVQFAKDYVVPEKLSLFRRYTKFGKSRPVTKATPEERKKGEELCAGLKERPKAFQQCVYDYVATGMDFSASYKLKAK